MKITVCQLPDGREKFSDAFHELVAHVATHESELLLLPEMPFSAWFASRKNFDLEIWREEAAAHASIEDKLKDIEASVIIGTRPIDSAGRRLNRGFIYSNGEIIDAHSKYYLPEQEHVWEQTWFSRGDSDFPIYSVGDSWHIGFAICSELWFMEHSRVYGENNCNLIVCPRAGARASTERWLLAGRTSAIISGAYCISSNRESKDFFGGVGWIIDPNGEVLATTSSEVPFVTLEVDLELAQIAKRTYPRYISR